MHVPVRKRPHGKIEDVRFLEDKPRHHARKNALQARRCERNALAQLVLLPAPLLLMTCHFQANKVRDGKHHNLLRVKAEPETDDPNGGEAVTIKAIDKITMTRVG